MRRVVAVARVGALLLQRAWAVVRPVASIVTVLGWIVAGAALVTIIVGWTLGWQEFVYLGLTLAAALLIAVAFLFGSGAFSVVVELTPRRVVAGDRAYGRMLVTNVSARRSTPTRLELPVGRGEVEFRIPALDQGAEQEELFAVPTQRRAVIVAGPAVSVRGDELGLLRRAVRWSEPVELFVHPRTTRLAPSASGLVRDLEGEVTKTITDSDISFHALRAYEPGDDRRNVHWRTSARTGQLMVRQFEETRRSQLLILLATDERYYADDDEFELAVSVMASIATHVIREGTAVSVVSDALQLRTATATTLLDDSSRLEQTRNRWASAREFARATTRRIPIPSVVMTVAGSGFTTSDFRGVQTLFRSETQALGLRTARDADPRIGFVGDLRMLTIGSLPDLGKLLRRAS